MTLDEDLKYFGSPAMIGITVIADGINSRGLEYSDLEILGLAVAPWLLQVLEKKNNLSWPWWEYGGRETCSTSVGMLEPAEV